MSTQISRPAPLSFKNCLTGKNAFYRQRSYLKTTTKDLCQSKALQPVYTWNTEHKITRYVKEFFSYVIFPIKIYSCLQTYAARFLLPSSNLNRKVFDQDRKTILFPPHMENDPWKNKRLTLACDGMHIDVMIVGKPSTLGNGTWYLEANGNCEFYEDKLAHSHEYRQILTGIGANGIVFNYPGVGASTGVPNRKTLAKAYRLVLTFLEDPQGIGAKRIVMGGRSMGGGAKGEALKTHPLKKGIRYVSYSIVTFSNVATAASHMLHKILGVLVRILGWNLDSVASSKKLQIPEIILQSANVKGYKVLRTSSKICEDDNVLHKEATLAKALLDDPSCPKKNKLFLGMKEKHNDSLENPSFIAQKLKSALDSPAALVK